MNSQNLVHQQPDYIDMVAARALPRALDNAWIYIGYIGDFIVLYSPASDRDSEPTEEKLI
ncbi:MULTISPECIES: hypothetical protein [unclassified Phyllobacterium]|uniref:hypothetical protein n=1 Tax=unclassified Phyllobacterium TaxID=2638441 RepID=UPI003012DE56